MQSPTVYDEIREIEANLAEDIGNFISYFYVATPYSKFPDGLEAAFVAACQVTARLVRERIKCYSPIAATHPVAIYGKIDPLDHTIWLPHDEPLMAGAHGMIVAMLPSWEISYGIGEEIKLFNVAGKPIFYLDPERL